MKKWENKHFEKQILGWIQISKIHKKTVSTVRLNCELVEMKVQNKKKIISLLNLTYDFYPEQIALRVPRTLPEPWN